MGSSAELRILALGGLGEVGMNCLALEQRGEVLVVDCGVTFDPRGIGVDVVHAELEALEPYRDRIAGVFLTHGHEDHIGALPYFLRRFDVPVWGPKYALGLVRERAQEHEILDHVRLFETRPRERYGVGSFTVEPIRVTHSIADATSLAIATDAGVVIHTGDFKFDERPVDGEAFDVERFEELGREGVALLMSDSTGIDTPGPAGDEVEVGRVLEQMIEGAKGAVVVAMFASNVHRLRMLGEIARRTRRYLLPLGRSVGTHSRVARATGYLDWPADLVLHDGRARDLGRDRILAIASGTQAEARAALARLARDDHPALRLEPSDTVILSSRVIPGNEVAAFAVMGDLLRRGVELRSWYTDRGVHVSGHAGRSEQRRMIEMVRPRAFLPLHGTLHHLERHAALARELGVPDVLVIEDGDTAVLDGAGELRKGARVPCGRVHVFAGRPLPPSVLHQRLALAAEGIAFVVVPVDSRGVLSGEIALVTRGVVDESMDARIVAAARGEARSAVEQLAERSDEAIAEAARLAVRRSFAKALGFKPSTVVTVQRR